MSLLDELNRPKPAGDYDLGVSGGTFQNVKFDTPVKSLDDILVRLNIDPDAFEIDGTSVRVSSWQTSKRTDDGDRDVITLYSYRGNIIPRRDTINLPALYAEVARTKHRPMKPKSGESTVVVCWADVQTGKVDHHGTTADLLERLEDKRAALNRHLKASSFSRIIVADVGDIVEGIENTSSQLGTNDLSLMDQVDVAATEFWKTIRLCARFAPVDVLSIPSNHAQWRRGKGLLGKPTDDWGLHISLRLERMADEVGLPVTFHRPADWNETLVFDVAGTRLGLAHGHQSAGPNGVTAWWAKMVHSGLLDCHILLTGHFHFPHIQPSGRTSDGRSKWHLQAPTLDNGSAWVANKMGEDGDPGLMVFQIDANGFNFQSLTVL